MGALVVTSCFGCGANKSWAETLTIVHRAGEFLVAGYARDWDWNSHMADGSVETILGSCEIDFLSGKGVASDGLDEGKPIAAQVHARQARRLVGRQAPRRLQFLLKWIASPKGRSGAAFA